MAFYTPPQQALGSPSHALSSLDITLDDLEAVAVSFANRFIRDGRVRREYGNELDRHVRNLRQDVQLGRLSPQEAARRAQRMRNGIMNAMRGKSSDLGLALARLYKNQGRSLSELQTKYATEIFQQDFSQLSSEGKVRVWGVIIQKAGEPNTSWNYVGRLSEYSGRGLWVLTILGAFHQIVEADDTVAAVGRQLTVIGGGMVGSSATVGAAGLACGPGAVVCVSVLLVVGVFSDR